MELVISVVLAILVVEAYAWLPKISEWLTERAVLRLRSEDQDRCREEWKAGLDALPNTVIRLVHALSYLGAAQKINADVFESNLAEINTLAEECGCKYSTVFASFRVATESVNKGFEEFEQSTSTLETCITRLPTRYVVSSPIPKTKMMAGKAKELINIGIDKVNDRLSHVSGLMLGASEKRDQGD
jgi:hypothetical protein